jgi:hypothetical protein
MSNYPLGAEQELIRRERIEAIEQANYELVRNEYLEESRNCLIEQTLMSNDEDPAESIIECLGQSELESIIRAVVLADAEQITPAELHSCISSIVRSAIEEAATIHADMKRNNGDTIYNM